MPYSGPNDPALPSNVKKLSREKRKKWVATWNGAYARCKDAGGTHEKCETKAFRIANGTIESSAINACALAYLDRYPHATWADATTYCTDAYERHRQSRAGTQAEASKGKVLLETSHANVLVEKATAEERERFAFVFSANVIPAPVDEAGVWSKNNRLYPAKAVDETYTRSRRYMREGGVATVYANHESAGPFSSKLPVGAVTRFYREGEAIRFRAGIVQTGEGADVIKLIEAGVLQTVSLRSLDWKSRVEELEGHGEVEIMEYAVIHGIDFAIFPGLPDTHVAKEEVEMDINELTLAQLQETRPDLVAEILEHQEDAAEPKVVYETPADVALELAIHKAANQGIGSLVAKYLTEHCESPEDVAGHIEDARKFAISAMYAGRRQPADNPKGQGGAAAEEEEEDEGSGLTEDQEDMVRIVAATR